MHGVVEGIESVRPVERENAVAGLPIDEDGGFGHGFGFRRWQNAGRCRAWQSAFDKLVHHADFLLFAVEIIGDAFVESCGG